MKIFLTFKKNEDGVSSLEFGLIAPFVMLFILTVTDIGMAINQRLQMDHAIRATSQYIMQKETDINTLKGYLEVVATNNVSITPGDQYAPVSSITQVCYCPDTQATLSCASTCPSGDAPAIYYDLIITKKYQAMFISDINLTASQRVRME